MKKYLLLILLVISDVSFALQKPEILIDPNKISENTTLMDVDGTMPIYLNKNTQRDFIEYSYSSLPPVIIINDVIVDGKKSKVNIICDFVGIYNTTHHGMRDIACGSGEKLKLIWDGKTYN